MLHDELRWHPITNLSFSLIEPGQHQILGRQIHVAGALSHPPPLSVVQALGQGMTQENCHLKHMSIMRL